MKIRKLVNFEIYFQIYFTRILWFIEFVDCYKKIITFDDSKWYKNNHLISFQSNSWKGSIQSSRSALATKKNHIRQYRSQTTFGPYLKEWAMGLFIRCVLLWPKILMFAIALNINPAIYWLENFFLIKIEIVLCIIVGI